MNIQEQVISIIADKLAVQREQVLLQATFTEDLKADSLDLVELVYAFEEQFKIDIPDQVVPTITTVQSAIDEIAAGLSARLAT